MSNTDTLKTIQLIWLLWIWLTGGRARSRAVLASTELPPAFVRRCRKLLELGVGERMAPGQSGTDMAFDKYQAWELAIGLRMSSLGMPQMNIAFVVAGIRGSLRHTHARIVASRPIGRERVPASDRPHAPRHVTDPSLPDTSCFLVIRLHEIHEAVPRTSKRPTLGWLGVPDRAPLVEFDEEQDIVFGAGEMAKRLATRTRENKLGRSIDEGGWMVLELSEMVTAIDELWTKVPEFKRGRPST